MELFCPRCGNTKGPFIWGFCANCFVEKQKPLDVPAEIGVLCCKKCGRVKVENAWREQDETALSTLINAKIRTKYFLHPKIQVEVFEKQNNNNTAKIKVAGEIDSTPIYVQKETMLVKSNGLCENCSRAYGNYFEAIIQIRADKKNKQIVEKKVADVKQVLDSISLTDSLARIVRTVSCPTGIDLYIGSKVSAKKVVRALEQGAKEKVIVSTKQQGLDKDTGKIRLRYTYCLRF